MPVESGAKNGAGKAFLISSGLVFELMAAACSSPQTTELNAGKRSKTLFKWVNLGVAGSALFITIAVAYEPDNAAPIIVGGTLACGLMYGAYMHARKSGLASSEPGTESY